MFLFCSYGLVYIIFLIHGVAVLLPWNMFINATDVSCNLCLICNISLVL